VVDVPQEKPPLLSGNDAQALQFLKRFADEVHMADNVAKNPPSHLVVGSKRPSTLCEYLRTRVWEALPKPSAHRNGS